MLESTQEALLVMGDSDKENEESDKDYIDVEIDKPIKQFRAAIKRPALRRTHNSRFSLSQPTPAQKRKSNHSPERGYSDETSLDQKALLKVLNSLQRDVRVMRDLVKKELPVIKTSIEELKTELHDVRNRVVAVAPPINIENTLSELSTKVDGLTTVVNNVSSINIQRENGVKLKDVVEVDKFLKQRKIKYYDFYSYSERHAIYMSWEQLQPPFVMSKYLPVLIENEPEDEYNARKRKAENNRICDLELLALRAQRSKNSIDVIDAEVAQTIQAADATEEAKNAYIKEWEKLVNEEEEKSRKIWEKTAKNLLDLPKRQQESNKVIEKEGKTYAAAAKSKPKKNPSDSDNGEIDEQMQVDPPIVNTEEQQQWTHVSGKNRQSHKQEKRKATDNVKTPSKPKNGTQQPSNFRRKGPKFKPKSRDGRWFQNQWGYQNHRQQWW